MHVQAYLLFSGRCEEALHFYRDAIGARIQTLMHYRESPDPIPAGCGPAQPDKVMHANFVVGDTQIMASDDIGPTPRSFGGFSLTLQCADAAEAQRCFGALAAQGTVQMPLGPTFFAKTFGMLQDRFGVGWMVIVPEEIPTAPPTAA